MNATDFQALFDSLYSPLCNYAFAIVKDHAEAEDIVQALFVEFWSKRDTLEIDTHPEHYLTRAVKFKCIDFQRKEIVKRKHVAEALHEANASTFDEDDSTAIQLQEALTVAIAQLPEKTREVFLMAKQDGLRYAEIADQLEISIKTVESQMGRAFKILREKLSHHQLYALLVMFFCDGVGGLVF